MFVAPERPVSRVFIHCSASDAKESGPGLKALIRKWHVEERKWSDIGYHYLIDKNGDRIPARNLESDPAAQRGHNSGTIAIMVHGLAVFTGESMRALTDLCREINEAYSGRVSFHGHCEVSAKACPVFNYRAVLRLDRFGRMPA